MAHYEKFTKAYFAGQTKHTERAKKDTGEYYKFRNREIDLSRTHLNYNLAPERTQINFVMERCKELKCLNRQDVNVMACCVVDIPPTLKNSPERHKQFFDLSYKFLVARHGEDNVVSSFVHLDEETPHMHFSFVPVAKKKMKRGADKGKVVERVTAKEVITKKYLAAFHNDFDDYMEREIGSRDFTISNGKTKAQGGNLTIAELKKQSKEDKRYADAAAREYDNLESQLSAAIDVYPNTYKPAPRTQEKIKKMLEKEFSIEEPPEDLVIISRKQYGSFINKIIKIHRFMNSQKDKIVETLKSALKIIDSPLEKRIEQHQQTVDIFQKTPKYKINEVSKSYKNKNKALEKKIEEKDVLINNEKEKSKFKDEKIEKLTTEIKAIKPRFSQQAYEEYSDFYFNDFAKRNVKITDSEMKKLCYNVAIAKQQNPQAQIFWVKDIDKEPSKDLLGEYDKAAYLFIQIGDDVKTRKFICQLADETEKLNIHKQVAYDYGFGD